MKPPSSDTAAPAALADVPLDRLDLGRGHAAIIGLQWGDEGKGQIVDVLTPRYDYVVRYNGGANAGHTVMIGDQKFALHLVPSGVLNPAAINVVGNGVVIDPAGILDEMDGLRQRGVTIGENLRISDRAHVVMPYHKLDDVLMEKALSAARGDDQAIGTTGRGIGPCYADKAQRSTAIRMGELLDLPALKAKLTHTVAIKNRVLGALADAAGEAFEPYIVDQLFGLLNGWADRLKSHICDTTSLLYDAMAAGKRVLFEGANACLLDVDHGTYPFVTSSNCSSLGIYAGAAVPGGSVQSLIGVVKTYTSRVGGGPMPTELFDATGEQIRRDGHEFGTTTGRPRRCGWLDLVAVRYAVRLSGITALACTGLSVLAALPKLKVCVAYEADGRRFDTVPADAALLGRIKPVYETLAGFGQPVEGCRSFDELPAAAKAYLRRIEQFVGVPVAMACVGRRRDQILVNA